MALRMTDLVNENVECPEHGCQQATYVCQHIVQGLAERRTNGFWASDNPDNPRSDAWCTACNELLNEKGGDWNDETEAYAGVKLLCGACYDRARDANAGHQ